MLREPASTHSIPYQTPVQHIRVINRKPQAFRRAPAIRELSAQQLLHLSQILLQLLIVLARLTPSVEESPQQELLYIVLLDLL